MITKFNKKEWKSVILRSETTNLKFDTNFLALRANIKDPYFCHKRLHSCNGPTRSNLDIFAHSKRWRLSPDDSSVPVHDELSNILKDHEVGRRLGATSGTASPQDERVLVPENQNREPGQL